MLFSRTYSSFKFDKFDSALCQLSQSRTCYVMNLHIVSQCQVRLRAMFVSQLCSLTPLVSYREYLCENKIICKNHFSLLLYKS